MERRAIDEIRDRIPALSAKYGNDSIVILAKGPSADLVSRAVFNNNLIIALNDAEWISPADITVFHEEWVEASLRAAGLASEVYVTSTEFAPEGGRVIRASYAPLSNDTADLMMSRFLDPSDIVIEETMLLTALEIARLVANHRGVKQTVYMIGFDFTPELGYARAVDASFSPELKGERRVSVESQVHFLRHAIYMLEGSVLRVVHVGTKDFSGLTAAGLNLLFAPRPVDHVDPPPDQPHVEITAELTSNHFGDRGRLERLVRAASDAGADFVKVQKRDVATFYSAEQLAAPYVSPFGTTFGEYRRQLELDRDDFAFLDALCREVGVRWFASVLDQPSFRFMMDLEASLIKLPSTISEHAEFLKYVADNYHGELVLSTGMTDQAYEDWVLEVFEGQERLYLLHCNSAYPTPDQHCNIGVVRHYDDLSRRHPNIVPGYSSHDHGWLASALAVAAGARMVEKHVKLANSDWAHFDAVAVDLTTNAFRDYVENVRSAQVMVGSPVKHITSSEHHKYHIAD